ncbi:hypothetical protein NQ317_005231 [Molorchus minor]|uniref:Uncharacterized protein n=1 Tax=Molorchus minor TaxID=1323400 RepID=A0ABQ9JQG3_9CUCU|nr:hypothetical protein NQ317_005231 [Molorchus minor]
MAGYGEDEDELVTLSHCDVPNRELELLGRKDGIVGNENFTYYYIHHLGNIILSLESIFGDVDLYVSETNMVPTYDPDTYDLHSATCGLDIVEVPDSFKSPISIGIYGYSAYEESGYSLEVFKAPTQDNDYTSSFLIIEEGNPQGIPEIKVTPPKDEGGKVSIRSKNKKKRSKSSFI